MSDVAVQTSDWRVDMLQQATASAGVLSAKDRQRNPLVPNNFFDLTDAGFPADVTVKMVPIPAQGSPNQMAQYHNMTAVLHWRHVKWGWISENGGLDGRANVPGAAKRDLGNGDEVATLSGYYLMFADRKSYEDRRAKNVERANQKLEYKATQQQEGHQHNARTFASSTEAETLTVDDLLAYEEKLPPARRGESMP